MRGVFYPKRRFCQLLFLPVGREHDCQRQEDDNAAQSADDVLDWHGMILIQNPTPALPILPLPAITAHFRHNKPTRPDFSLDQVYKGSANASIHAPWSQLRNQVLSVVPFQIGNLPDR
jgi:hypothetical protein